MFSLWTPLPEQARPATAEDGEAQPDEGKEDGENALPPMTKDQTRWVILPNQSQKIFVKFFSQKTGHFNQVLKFEIVGSTRPFDLNLQAICEFPTIT